jgi:hypothetical protein
MHPLLESAWDKSQRADFHTEHINQVINTFAKTQIQCVGAYFDRRSSEKIFRLDRPPKNLHPKYAQSLATRCLITDALSTI